MMKKSRRMEKKKMKVLKLQTKLFALFLVIAIVPLFILSYLSLSTAKEALEKQVLDDHNVIAEAKEGHIFSFLQYIQGRAIDFSSDGFIRDTVEKMIDTSLDSAMRDELATSLNRHLSLNKMSLDRTIKGIFILDLDGMVIASTDDGELGKKEAEEDYFLGALRKRYGEAHVSDAKLSHHFGVIEPSIAVSAPLLSKDTGAKLGVIVNFISITELEDVLSGAQQLSLGALSGGSDMGKTSNIYLVNKDKLIIAQSRFGDVFLKQKVNTFPVEECRRGKEVTGVYRDYKGAEVIGASMCLKDLDWTLLVEVETTEAFAPVKNLRNKIMFSILVLIALIFLLSGVISKDVTIGINDRDELLESLLRSFEGKFGKIAVILMRKNIQNLTRKNPRIINILPESMSKMIKQGKAGKVK